jgi:hypothetical protein
VSPKRERKLLEEVLKCKVEQGPLHLHMLPEGIILSVTDMRSLLQIGVKHLTSQDSSQVPGDQHPRIAVSFKECM